MLTKTFAVTTSTAVVVLNQPTYITFSGSIVNTNPSVPDQAEWIAPGSTLITSCGSNSQSLLRTVSQTTRGASFLFPSSKTGWVLCYKDGLNPWQIAPGISLDSVTIGGISNPGNNGPAIAVVGTNQIIQFTGSGIKFGDTASFIVRGTGSTVADCVAGNEAYGSQTATVQSDNTATFLFSQQPAVGVVLALCYSFAGVQQLFTNLPLTLVDISSVSPNAGPALYGSTYTVQLSGMNLIDGDVARVVWSNSSSSSDCSLANQILGTAVGYGTASGVPTKFDFVFGTAAIGMKVCFSARNQSYRLYPSITLNATAVTGLSVSTLASGSLGIAAVNGVGVAAGDLLKFVTGSSCTQTAAGGIGEVVVQTGRKVDLSPSYKCSFILKFSGYLESNCWVRFNSVELVLPICWCWHLSLIPECES